MSVKKTKQIKPDDQCYTAVWKETSPGPEQRQLERLFENNLIEPTSTPNTVRMKSAIFMKFSPRIFAVHFRKTKAKFGLFAKSNNEGDIMKTITELGSGISTTSTTKRHNNDDCEFQNDGNNSIELVSPPFVTWTYMDHDKKCNYVNVAVPIISGSTDVNFSVSKDGLNVHINYVWPIAMFNPKELFFDELYSKNEKQNISLQHPKIHALASHLLQSEITENSYPKGKIIIILPVAVVREIEGWTKKAVKKVMGRKLSSLSLQRSKIRQLSKI